MGVFDSRRGRLAVVVLAVLSLTLVMIVDVLGTLFFAVTVAYVLLPLKRWVAARRVPNRIAAGVATTSAFVTAVAIVTPLLVVVYQRRGAVFGYLEDLPEEFLLSGFGFTYVLEIDAVIPVVRDALATAAIALARAAPLLVTKLFLFTFVVYALLLRPEAVRTACYRIVPDSHHGDLRAFHERLHETLYGIYVVQAATAVGTFAIALVVFYLLGYETYFTFAVLAGVLQFVPIIGPSILVVVVSAAEYVAGNVDGAIATLVVGLVVIGALPDLLLRPRLARQTADLAASLYFIGFVAGGLSFGAVGVIAGPVVIGLLVEAFELASADSMAAGGEQPGS